VLSNIAESQAARRASNFPEHGNREWPPNRGFNEEPVDFTLLPGTKIDRYGSPYGTFTSPAGTPYRARAPKPGTDLKPHCIYEVNKPLTVKVGTAAPWFGYEGNGTQYELPDKVIALEKAGILTKINQTRK
jgi:hypothetical protein